VEQDAFIALLHHDDPDLQLWLLGDQLPAHAALKSVVKRMRAMRI
jgi:succinate dehydrogenase flavin-adding protein (antitoxin of CptAB toxin-antitoxin module)